MPDTPPHPTHNDAAFRLALADAIRPLADAAAVKREAARLLGRHLRASRVVYVEAEPTGELVLEPGYTDGVPDILGRYHLDDWGAHLRGELAAGRNVLAADIPNDPAFTAAEKERYAGVGIVANLSVPLLKEGRLAAVLGVHQNAPRHWTAADVALVEEVVGRTWDAVHRARAEAALRASEERFRTLFESMGEGFCVVEMLYDAAGRPADYRFLEVNPTFGRHTGFTDAVGRTKRELVPAHDAHWFETYGRVAATGEPERFVNEARAMGRWYDVYAYRVGGPGSRRVGILFSDITARKRAEDQVRESEGRFRQLAETIPQLCWMARPDGHIYWYNRRWYEYTGTTPEQMEGWGWQAVHDPGVLPRVVERWKASLASGEPFDMVFPLRGADGSFRPFLTRVAPLRDGDGRVTMWFGTNTDIAEQKRAEEALREEARRKDQFIAMLAHELRNPLAPISNAMHLLARSREAAVVDKVHELVSRQVAHLSRIVDDLLEVSRVARGKVALRRERVDLGRVVRQAAEDQAAAFDRAGVRLGVEAPDTPVWADGDRTRLAQVVANLLANAAKFTDPGGAVAVRLAAGDGQAVLTVSDTGVGLDPALAARLFEPFAQADQSLARSRGGLGLGLALVKGFVELHGGTVAAASPGPGRGSEFTVRLPVVPEPPAVAPAAPRAAAAPAASPKRVLIVEDNRDAADSLKMVFELTGYEVTVAYTGPDGAEAATRVRPDLVVCDIGLPGMDGYAVARRIRAELGPRAPVLVALTGYGEAADRDRALAAGFDQHFTKPADPAALEAALTTRT